MSLQSELVTCIFLPPPPTQRESANVLRTAMKPSELEDRRLELMVDHIRMTVARLQQSIKRSPILIPVPDQPGVIIAIGTPEEIKQRLESQ
jgi:hypothetical protein